MFVVVQFLSKKRKKELGVIPFSWINNGETHWPTNAQDVENIKHMVQPDINWPKFKILVVKICGKFFKKFYRKKAIFKNLNTIN